MAFALVQNGFALTTMAFALVQNDFGIIQKTLY
jgi:hypothetical protein